MSMNDAAWSIYRYFARFTLTSWRTIALAYNPNAITDRNSFANGIYGINISPNQNSLISQQGKWSFIYLWWKSVLQNEHMAHEWTTKLPIDLRVYLWQGREPSCSACASKGHKEHSIFRVQTQTPPDFSKEMRHHSKAAHNLLYFQVKLLGIVVIMRSSWYA